MIPTPNGISLRIASALAFLLAPLLLWSQERDRRGSDLVYADTTITALRHIADSMRRAFDALPPGDPLIAREQGIGSFVRLWGDSTEIVEAARAIADGASLDHIAIRYKELIRDIRREVVITRDSGRIGADRPISPLFHALIAPTNILYTGEETFIDSAGGNDDMGRRWLWSMAPMTMEGEDDSSRQGMMLQALLIPASTTRPIITERYARMIRYAKLMVDGTAELVPRKREQAASGESYERCEQRMIGMVAVPARPREADGSPIWNDDPRYRRWVEICEARWDTMAHDPAFVEAVAADAEAAIREDVFDPELREIVERCMPNDRGLELIRRIPPNKGCLVPASTDCLQMGAIARLAALSRRWPIFIKAHLSMLTMPELLRYDARRMNRWCTDELAAIGIDLPSLLLGLRLMPPADARDYAWLDEERLARAAAEPPCGADIATTLLDAILDRSLDDVERWHAYTLHLTAILRLPPDLRRAGLADLLSCGDELPGYIRDHLTSLAEWDRREHAGLGLAEL